MDFALTAEQESLRRAARLFLGEHSPPARVRRAMASPEGYDRDTWGRISRDLGWPALIIPERYGGAGGSHVDLAAVMEECGRALLCAPLLSSTCLATNLLLQAGSEEQKRRHLTAIASGELTATVAWLEPGSAGDAADLALMEASAVRGNDGFILNGTKTFVLDGETARLLLVAARVDGDPRAAISLFEVPPDAPGLTRRGLTTMDQTRRQAEITLHDVRAPGAALIGLRGEGAALLRASIDRASTALAAEQVGGAERCLEMAVEYAKTRVQFGRPIGSFQAIKHKCANMALQVESARSAAYFAAWAVDEEPADFHTASAVASAWCSEAFFACASENIQIHGGIGFTWEHDAHLYFKRSRSSSILFGDPASRREQVAVELLGA